MGDIQVGGYTYLYLNTTKYPDIRSGTKIFRIESITQTEFGYIIILENTLVPIDRIIYIESGTFSRNYYLYDDDVSMFKFETKDMIFGELRNPRYKVSNFDRLNDSELTYYDTLLYIKNNPKRLGFNRKNMKDVYSTPKGDINLTKSLLDFISTDGPIWDLAWVSTFPDQFYIDFYDSNPLPSSDNHYHMFGYTDEEYEDLDERISGRIFRGSINVVSYFGDFLVRLLNQMRFEVFEYIYTDIDQKYESYTNVLESIEIYEYLDFETKRKIIEYLFENEKMRDHRSEIFDLEDEDILHIFVENNIPWHADINTDYHGSLKWQNNEMVHLNPIIIGLVRMLGVNSGGVHKINMEKFDKVYEYRNYFFQGLNPEEIQSIGDSMYKYPYFLDPSEKETFREMFGKMTDPSGMVKSALKL